MSSPQFAVQALYSSHHGWLHTWLRNRLGNAADAADLAQDTFVRLLQRTERVELKAPRAFLRTIAQGLVIIISISVAISQLEVKTDLLNHVIVIVLITVGLAVALAMGLGSREIAGQILAGIYVRELYEVGQQVRVGEVEGQIEEIGTVKSTLLTEEGELVSLSNRILLEQHVSSR